MRRADTKTKSKKATIVVRQAPRDRTRAILRFGPLAFDAAIGRSGIASRKREGDGATPRASMTLLSGYRRSDRPGRVATRLPMQRISSNMLWCDDPAHPAYNRPVKDPFQASHERLLREDPLYDLCIVLDWNITMRRRGAGSAIFFHLARPGYQPTEGCIALSRRDMLRLMPHLAAGMRMLVM